MGADDERSKPRSPRHTRPRMTGRRRSAPSAWRGRVIGRGRNRVEATQDPTAHAEIIAIGAASQTLKSWRLDDCTPTSPSSRATCAPGRRPRPARPPGLRSPRSQGRGMRLAGHGAPGFAPQSSRRSGARVLAEECGTLLARFFQKRRPAANNRLENGPDSRNLRGGEMREWLNRAVSKTAIRVTVSRFESLLSPLF